MDARAFIRDYGPLRKRIIFIFFFAFTVSIENHAQASDPVDLLDLFHIAESKNQKLQISDLDFQANEAAYRVSLAPLLPHVSLSGKQSSSNVDTGANGIDNHYKSDGFTFSISQTLFDATQWEAISEATLKKSLSYIDYMIERQSLARDLVSASLDYVDAQSQLMIDIDHKRFLDENLKMYILGEAAGTSTIVETRSAQAKVSYLTASIANDKSKIRVSLLKLQRLTNSFEIDIKKISNSNFIKMYDDMDHKADLNNVYSQNLDILRSELNLSIARSKKKQAETEYLPKAGITFNQSYGSASYLEGQNDIRVGRRGESNSVVVTIKASLFDGFATTSTNNERALEVSASEIKLNEVSKDKFAEAVFALERLTADRSMLLAAKAEFLSAKTSLDASIKSLAAGLKVNLDVIRDEESYYKSEADALHANVAYMRDLTDFLYCLSSLNEGFITGINEYLFGGK